MKIRKGTNVKVKLLGLEDTIKLREGQSINNVECILIGPKRVPCYYLSSKYTMHSCGKHEYNVLPHEHRIQPNGLKYISLYSGEYNEEIQFQFKTHCLHEGSYSIKVIATINDDTIADNLTLTYNKEYKDCVIVSNDIDAHNTEITVVLNSNTD